MPATASSAYGRRRAAYFAVALDEDRFAVYDLGLDRTARRAHLAKTINGLIAAF